MSVHYLRADWVPIIAGQLDRNSTAYPTKGGHAVYTPTSASTLGANTNLSDGVVLPGDARHAIITVETAPIRYFLDGTTPTGTVGTKVSPGIDLVIENNRGFLTAFKFINDSSGAATVTVQYFK